MRILGITSVLLFIILFFRIFTWIRVIVIYIDRYKTSLVAKSYTQLKGLDFIDIFFHVVKLTTIKLLLSLAIIHN